MSRAERISNKVLQVCCLLQPSKSSKKIHYHSWQGYCDKLHCLLSPNKAESIQNLHKQGWCYTSLIFYSKLIYVTSEEYEHMTLVNFPINFILVKRKYSLTQTGQVDRQADIRNIPRSIELPHFYNEILFLYITLLLII